jgi:hypothetical protein
MYNLKNNNERKEINNKIRKINNKIRKDKNKHNDMHVMLCKRGLLFVKLQEYGKALEDFCYAYKVAQGFYFDYEIEKKNGDVWKNVSDFLEGFREDNKYWNVVKELLKRDERIKKHCSIWKNLNGHSRRGHEIIIKISDRKRKHYRKIIREMQKSQKKEVKNKKKVKTEQQGKSNPKKEKKDIMTRYFEIFKTHMKLHYEMKAKKYKKYNNKIEKRKIQVIQKF